MIEIREVRPDELLAWMKVMRTVYFIDRPAEDDLPYRADRTDFSRMIGAFEGERPVATFRSFASELTVPGGARVSADAVTNVAVLPTHRRRGLLRGMMARSLRAARDRGDVLSMLFASEASIYGRYGFGAATEVANLTVHAEMARFRRPAPGTVELVEFADMRPIAPAIWDRFRSGQPGEILRLDKWWDAVWGIMPSPFAPKPLDRVVLYRDEAGEPQGWVRYRVEELWQDELPMSKLVVHELVAATPAAYARLWQYTTEVDLVRTVTAGFRSTAERLPWLLEDGRAVRESVRADGLWVRILDPVAALSARTYLGSGEVVLEVIDEAGLANGRFRLEVDPAGARCAPTTDEPEVIVTIEALGAAYLGGVGLRLLAEAGLVEERRPGALAAAADLFASSIVPWCGTEF